MVNKSPLYDTQLITQFFSFPFNFCFNSNGSTSLVSGNIVTAVIPAFVFAYLPFFCLCVFLSRTAPCFPIFLRLFLAFAFSVSFPLGFLGIRPFDEVEAWDDLCCLFFCERTGRWECGIFFVGAIVLAGWEGTRVWVERRANDKKHKRAKSKEMNWVCDGMG